MPHCQNEIFTDFNQVFNRKISQRGTISITRPGRPINCIVVRKASMAGTKGVLIADPSMKEDKRRSGTAFLI